MLLLLDITLCSLSLIQTEVAWLNAGTFHRNLLFGFELVRVVEASIQVENIMPGPYVCIITADSRFS